MFDVAETKSYRVTCSTPGVVALHFVIVNVLRTFIVSYLCKNVNTYNHSMYMSRSTDFE